MASYYGDYFYDERQKQTFKSLCFVEANAGTVIKRLADVEADELRPFHVDKNRPPKFDNRGRLYHDNIFTVIRPQKCLLHRNSYCLKNMTAEVL